MNLYSIAAPMISAVKPIEGFVVLRRQEIVDTFGRSQTTITRIPASGSITPSGDNTLARSEDYQTQGNTITIITAFKLRGPSKDALGRNYQPDIIEWRGSRYIISTLNDWSGGGGGMVEAECSSTDIIDLPPE
jgi:hypothetical protein